MGIQQGVTLFLVAINRILGELGNGVDGSFFADDLAIYIITRSWRVASRVLQGVAHKLDAGAAERDLTFSHSKKVSMKFRKRRKRNKETIEIMLRYTKLYPLKKLPSFWGWYLTVD